MNGFLPSKWIAVFALGAALLTTGCGDDGPDDDGSANAGARYAVALRLLTGNVTQSVVVGFADDLASGEVDLSSALEVGSNANIWGLNGSGDFYITNGEELTLSKYRLEDGTPVLVDRIGLSRSLTGLLGETMVFDGPDRGFLFQTSTGEAVEVNLSTMEVTGSIDVSALLDPALPTFINRNEFFRGDELVGVTYGTNLGDGSVSPISNIFFFDPATTTFDVRRAPCGGLSWMMQAANGDLWFASNTLVASGHAIDGTTQAPCLVRLPAGSRDPEPNPLPLNDYTTGPTAGLVPAGDFSSILVRVLDTMSTPVSDQVTPNELAFSPGWDTWQLDLNQPEDASRIDRDPVVGQIGFFLIDGVSYENAAAADQGSSVLTRTTGPNAPAPGLMSAGVPIAIVRIR